MLPRLKKQGLLTQSKRLLLSIAVLYLPLVSAKQEQFNFILASSYGEKDIVLSDYYVSEKLDGVRAYWDGKRLYSRNNNRLMAPDWFVAELPMVALDGELWAGRQNFEKLSGIVRRQNADTLWQQVTYQVFDMPALPGDFTMRWKAMQALQKQYPSAYWSIVKQIPAPHSHAELQKLLTTFVAKGAEGLMLRRKQSLYKAGRSQDLIKLKLFTDAEATVVAHHAGKGKYKDMLGSISVVTGDSRTFKIGSGFSDAERQNPPPIGSVITYKYSGYTASGKPRFPVYWRIRFKKSR